MTAETLTASGARVWVGCLACYNAGALVGAWLDAADGPGYVPEDHAQRCLRCAAWWNEGDWTAAVTDLPAPTCPAPDRDGVHYLGIVGPEGDPHEEQWVMDHQGFGGFLSGECSPHEAARIAEQMAEIEADGDELDAVAAWLQWNGDRLESWADVRDRFADEYAGEADSGPDYAEQSFEDMGGWDLYKPAEYGHEARDLSSTWPFYCIDWERAWRELELGDGYYAAENPAGGVFVFRPS